jgi:ribonuclease E
MKTIKRILINASHPEERRVAIVEGGVLIDFYVEVAARESLKGNIYKATVNRVEPGLNAAFVEFGAKKKGFIQMGDIMPQYFGASSEGKKRQKIQDVLQKGQELIVQVEKDERDSKGASLTTYLSLAGRFIVMMPGQERVGISRKIEDRKERSRMREIIESLKPPKDAGFIVRTAASDLTADDISDDLKYLVKLWQRIQADSKKAKAPALIYEEHDVAVRTVRDYLTADIEEILVDDIETQRAIKGYLKQTQPWRKVGVTYYKDKTPLFAMDQLEEQIAHLGERFVRLPSRGYIVIDKTEALTSIDVNSGRGRKSGGGIEATAVTTNLEACDEVARQLRLRDIGGLIVIDFIDMMNANNRREVEHRFEKALASDKAHWDIGRISQFGLLEMTRERLRTAYLDSTSLECPACAGTGTVMSDEVAAVAAFRDMHAKVARGGVLRVSCRLSVPSANYLLQTRMAEIVQMEKDFKVSVRITADSSLTVGQYVVDVEREPGSKAPPPPPEPLRRRRPEPVVEPEEKGGEEVVYDEEPDASVELPSPEGPKAEAASGEKSVRSRRRRRRRGKKHRTDQASSGEGQPAIGSVEVPAIDPGTEFSPSESVRGFSAQPKAEAEPLVTPPHAPESEAEGGEPGKKTRRPSRPRGRRPSKKAAETGAATSEEKAQPAGETASGAEPVADAAVAPKKRAPRKRAPRKKPE